LGVDIAVPVGTDILAAHDGTVSVGWDAGGYGHYITLTGTDGLVTRYGHLDSVTVSNGQTVSAGDVISKSGNSGSSTGPHLHYEVMKDGRYINPLYFSLTNDDGSSLPAYGYAGSPMGDGSYAALIEEAERHLGKSYQWGAFGPNTFDCSGFVSYVLIHSGVKDTGRLTAQGLYNICTPVSPADAMPGDLIFFTGTYSAPHPVTHVGIYVGGGQFIHAGNPISYASANTSYWQSKFYAFGRIN
jgi:murein DD-endopeptidase MepM/ murein hydrolase activator NlpD